MTAAMQDVAAVRAALRKVIDPEAGLDIVSLGLVYDIRLAPGRLEIDLTMTSPACPMGDMILDDARSELRRALPEACAIDLRLVWEPPWSPERMEASAREHFGWGDN